MNFIPAIGPYDIKVYGSQKGYLNKPIEFIIRNENVSIQEILIINPNGNSSSCDITDKQLDGHLSLEFQPDALGLHEIRIYADKSNRSLYNSFEFTIYDSSKLSIKASDDAIVGRMYKFNVECNGLGDGNLIAYIEQQDRKLKPNVKQLLTDLQERNLLSYEISFVPELESICKVDVEFTDYSENIVNGDTFKLTVKAIDFIIIPFPLAPFPINSKSSFNVKVLRKNINNLKIIIRPASNKLTIGKEQVECELFQIEKNLYQVFFMPKSIERHFVEIYFENQLINFDRPVKLDIFDVSKVRAKMPYRIQFGELNTFMVDTTGAGEGNLEVIIKDGYDTLKAQLLKREKRKFEIGFFCERNMKHDVQVIFNGIQIKDSPFYIYPEFTISKSVENLCEMGCDDYTIIEGGPLDGLQCGEKMWIIYDAQSAPYYDAQFLVSDDNNFSVKHSKIQLEDGRWKIEYIPINVGTHQIQRISQDQNSTKLQSLIKMNVLHYSAQRIVYGYKLYTIDDSVQLVFDAANFKVQDILPEVKDPNDELVENLECRYLSDYLALKFTPLIAGGYLIHFYDRTSLQPIASSPYKVIVHEPQKEIIRSSGIYDLTRLTIPSTNLPKDSKIDQFNVVVYDSRDKIIQNCFFLSKKFDLIIEFITRTEGLHRIYLYINDELVDDNPFYIYINGDTYTSNTISGVFSPYSNLKSSTNNFSGFNFLSSSSNDIANTSFSGLSVFSNSDSQIITNNFYQTMIGQSTIVCAKKDLQFHFVISNKNIQGLCVFDPLNEPVSFKLEEDDHENGSIIIVPKLEGAYRISGLIEGRDFEAQLFVLGKPEYENLFDMNNYGQENTVEKPYIIALKETNLEVDVYDPLGERVDVRYSGDNLATFVPRTTGYFKIYISDYHGPILGSPFYALIHAQKDRNDLACVESSGIRDTILNEETKFVIRNKDLEIDVQIKDPIDRNLALRKKRTSQGFLQVFYTPDMIGPHEIHIYKDGLKVMGSPIIIFVSDPNKVKVENLRREARVNQTFSFNIDATQAGEGFIRVNIKDPKLNDILPEINELDDRIYLVSFLPEIIGVYEFSLTFNKYHLLESPFKLHIIGDYPTSSATKSPYNQTNQHHQLNNNNNNNNRNRKENLEDLIVDDSNQLVSEDLLTNKELNNFNNIEYELNNWNLQLNNSLNKIMEATNPNQKRALTPITDTSEEDSNENNNLIYRGETYIENVERLPDGTSHLLLRIEDDNELIDAKNPNKARGRYKYRFKRIPLPENWASNDEIREKIKQQAQQQHQQHQQHQQQHHHHQPQQVPQQHPQRSFLNDAKLDMSDQFSDDSEPELIAIAEKGRDIVRSALNNAVRRLGTGLDDIKEESESISSSQPTTSSGSKRKEASKSKHFKIENPTADQANRSFDSNETIGDVVRTMSISENDDTKNSDTQSESEINVANENLVTKLTKEKQKKINQEKTVVIEENYVITPKNEADSKSSKADKSDDLLEKEENSKSFLDNEFKITTKESGKNKPKKKEKLVRQKHTEPTSTVKDLGDEKLIEKFKPEETIQYEYEQVIEQPDNSHSNEPDNMNNIKIENTQKKTTKYQTKEKFEKVEDATPDKVKKTTTDRTTFITEEEEDKIIETIEKSKDVQEFTYQQLNNKQSYDSAINLKSSLSQIAERLQPSTSEPSSSPLHTVTVSSNLTKGFEFSHTPSTHESEDYNVSYNYEEGKCITLHPTHPNVDDTLSRDKSFNQSGSSENIIDYYKLQPVPIPTEDLNNDEEDFEDERLKYSDMIQPVDINMLQIGEQFKPDETVSYNDLATLSKGLTTKQSDQKVKEDDEDSLAEIEENFIITFRSPNEQSEGELKIVKTDSPQEKIYYKPIETFSTEDFYSTNKGDQTSKPIDFIKAKFENKEPEVKPEPKRSTSRSDENAVVGKLPKSKVEIYDKEKRSESVSSGQSRGSRSSDSDEKQKELPKPFGQSRFRSSLNEIQNEEKPFEIKKQELDRKSSFEEELKRIDSKPPEIPTDKGIKSLLNRYERKPSQESESNLSRTESPAPPDQQRTVKKLPQNIVQLFDRKESTDSSSTPRSRSSYRSNKSDTDQPPYVRSAKSSHSSTRNELQKIPRADSYQNDDVFEDSNNNKDDGRSSDSGSGQEKVRKLSKLLIDQYEKKDQPLEARLSTDRKSRSDTKSDTNESTSSSFEERKKLPKSTLELYEPKSAEKTEAPAKTTVKEKIPSDSSIKTIESVRKPSDKSDIFTNKTKGSTIILVNQNELNKDKEKITPHEDIHNTVASSDSGVKDLVFKYEKRPSQSQSSEEGIQSDESSKKSPTIKKIVSSLIEESKSSSPTRLDKPNKLDTRFGSLPDNGLAAKPNKESKEEEKSIKKLINKYEIPKLLENLIEPADSLLVETKYHKTGFDEAKKKSREHSVDSIFDKVPNKISNLPQDNEYHHHHHHKSSTKSDDHDLFDRDPYHIAQQNEKGVKRLVDIYEKKPIESTDSSSSTIATESPRYSKSKSESPTVGKLGKFIEKYEKNLSSSNELPVKQQKNQNLVYSVHQDKPTKEPESIVKNIDMSKKPPRPYDVKHDSNNAQVSQDKASLNAPKNKEVNLIKDLNLQQSQLYDKQIKHKENISDNNGLNNNLETNIVNINNNYNKSKLIETNNGSFVSQPDTKIFHNDLSNLTAVLHIPGPNSGPIKKSPKIKVVLKVDTTEQLRYNVTTTSGHKVPFKVKQKNNKSLVSFSYHRVVDFNVAIRNQNELNKLLSSYKAQLEINVMDEYDFRIVKRDNYELVPIEVNRKLDNIYEIFFEPKSTSHYILKATLKNDAQNDSVQTQNKAITPSKLSTSGSSSSTLVNQEVRQISEMKFKDYEDLLEKTKTEIHKKLTDLRSSPIKVLLEVEHRKPILFEVTKTSNGKPIEFQTINRPGDRHTVYFNYESIVDFTISVRKDSMTPEFISTKELLNALLEISVVNDYEFQIIKKDTQEPIDIIVYPKNKNIYKIKFRPNPVTKYTLKANQIPSLPSVSKYESIQDACLCDQTAIKSKLNQTFLNPIIDQLPSDLLLSNNDNTNNNVKINVSITNPHLQSESYKTEDSLDKSLLNCTVYNPKNLEISELPPSNNSVSFIVNTKSAGSGELKCYALHSDGTPAYVEQYRLDKYIYSVKIHSQKESAGLLSLYLEHINEIIN